jgi:tetratricopeptide (TPR) repeat protein
MKYELFDHDELIALIKQDMKTQQFSNALEKTKFILKEEKIPVELFSLAGKLYASLELFERARFFFSEYTRHVPNAFVELFQLGMVEKDMGNIDSAIEIWKKLSLDNNDPEVFYYLADAYVVKFMFNEARECLLNILENAPDDSKYLALADQLLNRIKAH